MNISDQVNGDPLTWLLETADPGVRYLALRDLIKLSPGDPELMAARQKAHRDGPIAKILSAMDEQGFWVAAGAGYNPKYRSTVWAVTTLAQLGASAAEDSRIARACSYMLDHAFAVGGQFSMSGAPSGTIDCLQGNLAWALVELGCADPRLDRAFEWMARTVTGEGIAPLEDKTAKVRYYSFKSGPIFACGINHNLPCAWGSTKVMLAFSRLPQERRTSLIKDAMRQGEEFLLSVDPATALYPFGSGSKPSPNWWKFGFPLFYITDLLQTVEVLTALGYRDDPRLANAYALIREKQDDQGRWRLEFDYAGKMWVDFGEKNKPNKWVTLRALRALALSYIL